MKFCCASNAAIKNVKIARKKSTKADYDILTRSMTINMDRRV